MITSVLYYFRIKTVWLLAITLAVTSQSTTFVEPPSPCPNVFKYVPPMDDEAPGPGTEKWYGVVNLTTDITLHALWLNIILDRKADILGNWIGEVTTVDNLDFKIENTKMKVVPEEPLSVRFFIQYNAKSTVPKLHTILFNGKEICNADNPQHLKEKNLAISSNYELKKETSVELGTNRTIIQSSTVASTKNPYDRYQIKNSYKQDASLQPSPVRTEKAEILLVTTDNPSKSWSLIPSKIENNQGVKSPSSNKQTMYEIQASSKNSSQSKSETLPQNESTNNQQQDSKKVKHKEQLFQRGASVVWSENMQVTTENNLQAMYDSASNSQHTPWLDNNLTQEVIDNNKQKSVNRYKIESQIALNSNDKISSDGSQAKSGSLQTTTEKINYNIVQVWSPPVVSEIYPTKLKTTDTRTEETPMAIVANSNYFSESDGQKLQTRIVNKEQNIERIGAIPESAIFAWQPEKVSGPIDSKYAEEDNRDDHFDNRNRQSSNQYQGTEGQHYSASQPSVDDFTHNNPTVQQEEGYFGGGIPTLYIPNQTPEASCGKVTKKAPTYLPPGSSTSEGQWPWQAALYQQQTVDFKYICGGTLVSYRHVITAAHCVARKNSKREVNKNTLTVYLGKFNLRTSVEGVQIKFVSKIIIHPDYNAMTYSRDLAILELRESVSYTDWVRPACLWPENETGLRSIVGKKGSVVGWGSEVTGVSKEELNLIEMPVVAQETCINSYIEFYEKFTSDYTYCAGYNDGNSICNGDSGGGMVFRKGNTWHLRGIASISVARSNEYRCDPTHYVIFTDIAKFLPWIEEYID